MTYLDKTVLQWRSIPEMTLAVLLCGVSLRLQIQVHAVAADFSPLFDDASIFQARGNP